MDSQETSFHYAEIADDHERFVEKYKDHELFFHSNEVLRILDFMKRYSKDDANDFVV